LSSFLHKAPVNQNQLIANVKQLLGRKRNNGTCCYASKYEINIKCATSWI